jgi:polysaccharide chain length determinant protein (PEP-CTERM system associated)
LIPGKTYKPEDYLQIAWRRKWVVLVPFMVASIATAIYAGSIPNLYRAESLIQAIPQRVPESFVRSTVTLTIQDRLQSIAEQIFSRTRLERTIEEFDLYRQERQIQFMENIVDRMRRSDVGLQMVSANSFKVSFVSTDPRTALEVTERLASFFIEENLRDRASLAQGTTQFLESELDEARQRLIAHEKRLEDYRRRHAGELPSQVDANLQAIQTFQMQLQALAESINRDRDRRLLLEKLMLDAREKGAEEPATSDASGQVAPGEAPGPVAVQLEVARKSLAALLVRLKPEHPDVLQAQRLIRELERRRDLEAEATDAATQTAANETPTPTRGKSAAQLRIEQLEAEIAELDRQLTKKETDEYQARASLEKFQARVEEIPARESEMTQLMRDYTTLQEVYTSLLRKNQDSKIAENLERRQISEQFKVIDAARLPQRPFSPNRVRMNLMGSLAGLGVGLALLGLLEYRDTSLKGEEDVAVSLGLPVVALVPVLRTSLERQKSRRRRILSLAALTVLTSVAGLVWTLVR